MSASLPYQIRRHARAKRLSVTVHPDRRVVVTAPPHADELAIFRYMKRCEKWVLRQLADMEKYKDCILLPSGRRDYVRHKERARNLVRDVLDRHCPVYGVTYNRLSIKNLRSNWGSCSAKGNLNFNYKVVHVPHPLAEYVVVHELCHLLEFNHSRRFWDLVARTVPDHKARRKELRTYLM